MGATLKILGAIVSTSLLSTSFLSEFKISSLSNLELFLELYGNYFNFTKDDLKALQVYQIFYPGWFLVGWFIGWPLSNSFGRNRGILYSSLFRLIAFGLIGLPFFAFTKDEQFDADAFLWQAQPCEGVYAGLLSFLGPVYVFEIVSKKPNVGGGSIYPALGIALYIFFSILGKYLFHAVLPEFIKPSKENRGWWVAVATLLGFSTFLQTLLHAAYFPEPPSFWEIQQNEPENAECEYNASQEVNDNYHEVQNNCHAEEFGNRSITLVFLMCLFHIPILIVLRDGSKALYHLLDGDKVSHGEALLDIFVYAASIIVYSWSDKYFNNNALKKSLFFSYSILLKMLPILYVLSLWKLYSKIISALYIGVLFFYVAVLVIGPQIITTTMVLVYPTQKERAGNVIYASFGLLPFFFVYILVVLPVLWLFRHWYAFSQSVATGIAFFAWLTLFLLLSVVKCTENIFDDNISKAHNGDGIRETESMPQPSCSHSIQM